VADWVIRAQFGHVSPAMMAVYSHVRRKALDGAASALEPEAAPTTVPPRAQGFWCAQHDSNVRPPGS